MTKNLAESLKVGEILAEHRFGKYPHKMMNDTQFSLSGGESSDFAGNKSTKDNASNEFRYVFFCNFANLNFCTSKKRTHFYLKDSSNFYLQIQMHLPLSSSFIFFRKRKLITIDLHSCIAVFDFHLWFQELENNLFRSCF